MLYYAENSSEGAYIYSNKSTEQFDEEAMERRVKQLLTNKEWRRLDFISWLSQKKGWGNDRDGADKYSVSSR